MTCPAGKVDGCDSGTTKTHQCVSSGSGQTAAIDPKSDVVACAKTRGPVGGTDLFYAIRSKKTVKFENTAGGDQANDITSVSSAESELKIQLRGLAGGETIVVDLKAKTALWTEDSNPKFSRATYTHCAGFPSFDEKGISSWLQSLDL